MLEIQIIAVLILSLLVIAWGIGRLHIACIGSREVGRLTENRLNARMKVYGVPAGALVAALAVSESAIKVLPVFVRMFFVGLVAVSLMFGILVMWLSNLEVNWYKSEIVPWNARRRKLFVFFCFPVLYSSLYLYWLALVPAWLIFLVGLMKAQLE